MKYEFEFSATTTCRFYSERLHFSSFYTSPRLQGGQRLQYTLSLAVLFSMRVRPKPAQKTRKKYKTQICYFPPTLFHFTSWKGCTVVTSCIPREMANQSAINLSVCMFARIHRVNKGSGMVMRCAVTSHAWFHSNY